MIHKREIKGLDMDELVEEIGDLHYESLQLFITKLQDKLTRDANKDMKAGREQLAECLYHASQGLGNANSHIRSAKEISEPYNKNNEKV